MKNFAVLYVCDLDQVPDFKQMYELYDPVTLMFFFRNKHMMCDFGTGNNNKLNWVLEDKQELIDIIETIYRGAKKGRGLVVSPKGKKPTSALDCPCLLLPIISPILSFPPWPLRSELSKDTIYDYLTNLMFYLLFRLFDSISILDDPVPWTMNERTKYYSQKSNVRI